MVRQAPRAAPAQPEPPHHRLSVSNRQHVRGVNTLVLRRLARYLIENLLHQESYAIGIHLVGPRTMARLNWAFLRHEGTTDVITFDYNSLPGMPGLAGELFISVHDAVQQAGAFGTTWPSELARYVIHGLLHLSGHDDQAPAPRRRMKTVENRLIRRLAQQFPSRLLAAGRSDIRRTRGLSVRPSGSCRSTQPSL